MFVDSNYRRAVAKLNSPGVESTARSEQRPAGTEVQIVHDNSVDSGLQPVESKEPLPESHQAEAKTSDAKDAESTSPLTIPSNGSSTRKIEANRRNAKKSTGPKTSVGKTMSSWNSTRHGLLSKKLPATSIQNPKEVHPLVNQPAPRLGTGRHIGRSSG